MPDPADPAALLAALHAHPESERAILLVQSARTDGVISVDADQAVALASRVAALLGAVRAEGRNEAPDGMTARDALLGVRACVDGLLMSVPTTPDRSDAAGAGAPEPTAWLLKGCDETRLPLVTCSIMERDAWIEEEGVDAVVPLYATPPEPSAGLREALERVARLEAGLRFLQQANEPCSGPTEWCEHCEILEILASAPPRGREK